MKMHVNRIFRIFAALLPLLLAAGCSDSDEGPGKPLEITLSSQTLELERSETGSLRFALSPWKSSWPVSRGSMLRYGAGGAVCSTYLLSEK